MKHPFVRINSGVERYWETRFKIGDEAERLLLDIPGMQSVHVFKYSVFPHASAAFDFDEEIAPAVEAVLMGLSAQLNELERMAALPSQVDSPMAKE